MSINFPEVEDYLTPDFKRKLYEQYFEKEFPGIDPNRLTDEQWHRTETSVETWFKAVRRELRLVEHRNKQATIKDWGNCEWCHNVGPLWLREDAHLCIYCRDGYDAGTRKIVDLEYKRAFRSWESFFSEA